MELGLRNRRSAAEPPPREKVASWLLAASLVAAIEWVRGRQGDGGSGDRVAGLATLDRNSGTSRASWTAILRSVYKSFEKDRILAVSAGITFYGLLAIFPALAAFLSIYGLFADVDTVSNHLAALADILPGGAIEIVGEQIKRIASATHSNLGLAFFAGLAVSVWSANSGMRALIDGLNIAYGTPEKRGFIKLTLVSLGFTAGAILAVLAALSLILISS